MKNEKIFEGLEKKLREAVVFGGGVLVVSWLDLWNAISLNVRIQRKIIRVFGKRLRIRLTKEILGQSRIWTENLKLTVFQVAIKLKCFRCKI